MKNRKAIIILTIMMSTALAVVSFFGAFDTATYDRDSPSMAAQGAGQDLVDLVLVVPLVVLSLIFMMRNSRTAWFIFGGTIFYILYSFFIYTFGVYFNKFFLLYCLILGSSFYLFVLVILELSKMDVEGLFDGKVPNRLTGVYLLLISALFYLLWLRDIVPALLDNAVPPTVSDYNLLVNPVHVLDLSLALPGLIVTAVLLMRKRRLGYILTPVLLVFLILLTIALVGMVMMAQARGITEDMSIAGIFVAIALVSTVLLYFFLKNIPLNKKGRG